MNLHEHKNDFKELVSIVAVKKNLPESAIIRDYFIVLLLSNLANSEYASRCVFKGGTSLSKCYPGSIERFSEDIDLTFLRDGLSNNQCSRHIKKIESIMTIGFNTAKIESERSDRSKSMYVWMNDRDNKIKLEIGGNIKPDPYSTKSLKSYIHEYLEENMPEYVEKFGLHSVSLNVLNIERTFIDKVMSVKRHALCGSLNQKVRHIYDVTMLYKMEEIKTFLNDKEELKRIVALTKDTDFYYLEKRKISVDVYNPKGKYNFKGFKDRFDNDIRKIYESMHNSLLYTDEKQNFDEAIITFEEIDDIFISIDE